MSSIRTSEYNPERATNYLEHLKVQNRRFAKIQTILISTCKKYIGKKPNTRTINQIKAEFKIATRDKWSISYESTFQQIRIYAGGNVFTICTLAIDKDERISEVNEEEFLYSLPVNISKVYTSFEAYSEWYLGQVEKTHKAIADLEEINTETYGHHFPRIDTYNLVKNQSSHDGSFQTWFYEDMW